MNKILRITLIVLAVLVLSGGLVFGGLLIGRRYFSISSWYPQGYRTADDGYFPGRNAAPLGPGMMGRGAGRGSGMMQDGYGPGMMGSGVYSSNAANLQPLTVDQAYQSAEKYLATLDITDLKIAEVMVFDNNAYVRVVEQGTGIGAFELLVDPVSQVAYPEPGPDMMWNLKYGGLNHQQAMGGRGGMMGVTTWDGTIPTVSADMSVTATEALQNAQAFLDRSQPGTTTAPDADPFYGYYTIDILRDGKVVGMLSVNGFNGQVFLHTWHGTFVTAQDY